MKKKWIAIIFLAPIGIAIFIVIGGEIVMHLWNWLAPTLFGWRQINFWQAFGLLALCRILFGGVGVRGRHRYNPRRMDGRWEQMTPEEREKFRQGVRSRWGGCGTSPSEAKEPAGGSV
jgi:hypothetical protein